MTMKRMAPGKIVYEFFMTAYFQMLGNFGLDILEGEGNRPFQPTLPQLIMKSHNDFLSYINTNDKS